jgi:hypothetical protein
MKVGAAKMKKRLLIGIMLMLVLGMRVGTGAQAVAAENQQASFSGVYEVNVVTDQGQNQSGQITIKDLKNGEVQVDYDYEGHPFGLVGEVSGDPEQGGAVCRFAVNYTGVVKAEAEMTLIKVDDDYQLRGQGEGDYNYQGHSGHITGQVTGRRIGPLVAAAPSQFPLLVMAVIAGLAILAVAIANGINVLRR